MKLKVLGSSSKGNGYILDNGKEALLIEGGIPYRMVLRALEYDRARIRALVLSHEHGDHAAHISEYLRERIPCFMSRGTARALNIEEHPLVHILSEGESKRTGGFALKPFRIEHDAQEPFGFLINHPESGKILFATDTYYIRYRFRGLSQVMLECNYELGTLINNHKHGIIGRERYERTLASHMSLGTCLATLRANDLRAVNNIVLLHLSELNADPEAFRRSVADATLKTVTVANKDVVLDFDKAPF